MGSKDTVTFTTGGTASGPVGTRLEVGPVHMDVDTGYYSLTLDCGSWTRPAHSQVTPGAYCTRTSADQPETMHWTFNSGHVYYYLEPDFTHASVSCSSCGSDSKQASLSKCP